MTLSTAIGIVIPAWCGITIMLIARSDYYRRYRTAAARRCADALRRLSDSPPQDLP